MNLPLFPVGLVTSFSLLFSFCCYFLLIQSFQVSRFGGRSPNFWCNNENLPIWNGNLHIYYKFGEFCLKPFFLIGQHRGDVFCSTLGVLELLHVFHNSCKRDCDCKNTTRLPPHEAASLSRCTWLTLIRSLATPASEKEGFPHFRHRCF